MYINLLKQKQELEKSNLQNLEQKHQQQKIKAEFWINKIEKNIEEYIIKELKL